MTLTLPVRVSYHQATHYTKGRNTRVRAFVNHRMVGTVAGTRAYFTNPNTRPVSTHFGIGLINGKLVIDQYVPLDDTAYGNGNYDVSGVWDDWGYPLTNINAATISIEHQDQGDPAGKGVVPEVVQQASIALQALILRGTAAEWKLAGIVLRDWDNATILRRELSNIVPGPRTIITHNDIAGRLKPYCWKPWLYDKVGFPRTKYITGIKARIAAPPAPVPQPPTGGDMPAFTAPIVPTTAQIAASSWLYVKSDFAPDANNVQISADRWMPLVGKTATGSIVSYVGSDGVNTGKTYFVKPVAVKATKAVAADCTAAVAAATAPLKAQVTSLTADVAARDTRIAAIKAKTAAYNADIQND